MTSDDPAICDPAAWMVGYVYLLGTGDAGYWKIGFSRSPSVRLSAFRCLPFAVTVAHVFPVGTRAVESWLHGRFSGKRCRSEWFRLTTTDVAAVKRIGHARSVGELKALFAIGGSA